MFRTALAAIVLATASLAGTASAQTGPGGFSAGPGCSVQCIEKALVTPTASGGTVQVETSVPASVVVTATKLDAVPTQLAAPGVQTHASVPAFVKERSILLAGLQPKTTYRIVVTATDIQGKKSARVGTFTTLDVQTALPPGPGGYAAPLSCTNGCIQKAWLAQSRTAPRTATIELRTTIPARLVVRLSHGAAVLQVSSGDLRTSWTPTIAGLLPATTYAVLVRATDASGKVDERTGSFRTVGAIARVTILKLQVVDDAEKGANRGEIRFAYWINGRGVSGGGRRKIGSGTTLGAPVAGTSRPGATVAFPLGADARLFLSVTGDECDRAMRKNCDIEEASGPNTWDGVTAPKPRGGNGKKEQWARAVGVFELGDVLDGDALPPWFGTGVSAPAGHDGYMVIETSSHRLKFRALAYVDIDHQFD